MACILNREQLISKIYTYLRAGDILSIVDAAVDDLMKRARGSSSDIIARLADGERVIEYKETRSVQLSQLTMDDLTHLCEAIDEEIKQKEE